MLQDLTNLRITTLLFILSPATTRGPPELTADVERNVIVRMGESVKLSCPVHADPTPMYSWTKDDHFINQGWERFKIGAHALKIKSIELEDTGRYKCVAANGYGSVELDYLLYVMSNDSSATPPPDLEKALQNNVNLDLPEWTHYADMEENRNLARPEGSEVTLHCRASSLSQSSILWFHNGSRIMSGSGPALGHATTRPVLDNEGYSLHVTGVQKPDAGKYMCKVTNEDGAINYTYTVNVQTYGMAKPELLAPHPENQTVAHSTSVKLDCHIRSLEQPNVQWLKYLDSVNLHQLNSTIKLNGRHMLVLGDSRTTQVSKTSKQENGIYRSQLRIDSADISHSGEYMCVANNRMGQVSNRSAFINVTINAADGRVDDTTYLTIIIAASAGIIIVILCITLVCVVRQRHDKNKTPAIPSSQPLPPPRADSHMVNSQIVVPNYNNIPRTGSQEDLARNSSSSRNYSDSSQHYSDGSQKILPMYMPQQMMCSAPYQYPHNHSYIVQKQYHVQC